MLLAMMFSCQPVTEDIDSGNSNSNNTDQGGNTGGGGGEQTADTITITLIGTDGKEFDKFDIKIGEEIQLPANVERFVCWNTKADGSGESYTGKIKFTKDMTLYLIVLAKNAYTITYVLDGGVNDKANPLSFTADDKITLKNPSKDGYRFSGWYETADFSGSAVKSWAAGDKKTNVTLYAKWRAFDDKVLTEDGTGVYSYSVCIDALNNGGNSKDYPSFSIFLMTDGQIESMKSDGYTWVEKSEFFEATKTKPVYQICSYGEMRTDTTKTGDYAVWGNTPVNGKLEYYEGISASIEETNFIVTVDMTKLANVELKSYLDGEETYMTDDDIVSLSNYKPYISLNLDYDYDEETYNSYIVELDLDNNEQLYGMNSGASFPTNLKEDAPAVPTFYDLTYFYGSMSQYPVELKNNAYTFVAPEGDGVGFFFMNFNPYAESAESYPVFPIYQIGGEPIESLNKNFPLDDLYAPKNSYFQIKSGVLTAGNMYTITLDVKGNNEAYAKVSEVKPTSIKINSTTHKTSYYKGDDINVANLTVEATTADGTKFTVNVVANMISGFDSSTLGKQTVTITLNGCTATYSVDVKDVNVTELNVTADKLVDTIKGLTAGEYYSVKVSGEMTDDIMRSVQNEMEDYNGNNKDVARIALDLSNTTGLTYINNSFYDCHGLTSIVFPEGVTSIPYFSNCSNLTSITIPASVENVSSISNCKKLTTFEVAENSEYFSTSDDGKILYGKGKTVLFSYPSASGDVTIPNGVTTIGYDAFSGCNSLTSVIIPDSVTSIGSDAFENCENLESVTIGAGVTSISSDSFSGCSSLTSIEVDSANQEYSSDGKMLLSKDKTTLLMYPSATGDVTIPNGVIEIGNYAFQDCDSLTSVTIPDSVTTIEYNAFKDCYSLTSVTLGKNVKEIESSAFEYCRSLTSVTIPDSVTSIGNYAFQDCDSLTSVTFENTSGWNYSDDSNYANGKEINVTDEAKNATYLTDSYSDFYWYRVTTVTATASNIADIISNFSSGVYKLTITETINLRTLESIGSAMKNNRSMLIELDLSGTTGLTEIPEKAFAGCSLIGMVLPEGITTIGNSAFSGCNFKKLEIPNSVTYIGSYALPYDLEYNEYNNGYYLGNSENPYLVFVRLKDSEYSSSSCEINSKTKIIAGNAFYYFENLTNVTIPDGVISIGDSAFYYCKSLTSVIIPDSVTTIGDKVFSNCENLISVTIPAGVTTIGDYAFYYCENLTSVTIPDSVTTIGNDAFYSCNSLTSVTIPASVTTIGNDAFCSCYNLTTVNYKGEEWDWWNILIGRNNDYLTDATINYNYTGE